MRPDGKRVKDLPPIVAAIPYIMPKRYDAWNTITENIDEEVRPISATSAAAVSASTTWRLSSPPIIRRTKPIQS